MDSETRDIIPTTFVDDPHSYFDPKGPVVKNAYLMVTPDFGKKVLECIVRLGFSKSGPVALDTHCLQIKSVFVELAFANSIEKIFWEIGEHEPILGRSLMFEVPALCEVTIEYSTSPDARGLLWLDAEQTADQLGPYLLTQGEMINARSFMPCQDTPQVRSAFHLEIEVPAGMRALASGSYMPGVGNAICYDYVMPDPIPAYQLAFAVGHIGHLTINRQCTVYAEPSMLQKACVEFNGVSKLFKTAAEMLGPSVWHSHNILVLPGMFPMGGMENSELACLSPTTVVGDGSGRSVLAHEYVHWWFGNQVTIKQWCDFWIKEGATTYFEWRVIEKDRGSDVADLYRVQSALQYDQDMLRLGKDNARLSALCPDLTGLSPDDYLSHIPYHKGALFMMALEGEVGQGALDACMRLLLASRSLQAIGTDEFLAHIEAQLPGVLEKIKSTEWISQPGLPSTAPKLASVLAKAAEVSSVTGAVPPYGIGDTWLSGQWVIYVNCLMKRNFFGNSMHALIQRHGINRHPNPEVLSAFFTLMTKSSYIFADEFKCVYEQMVEFLSTTGRMKYIIPIFTALPRQIAEKMFKTAGKNYHPLAKARLCHLLGVEEKEGKPAPVVVA